MTRNAAWKTTWLEGGRRHAKTGERLVFVLNRRDESTRGTLTGPDFQGVAKLTDVISGRKECLAFECETRKFLAGVAERYGE